MSTAIADPLDLSAPSVKEYFSDYVKSWCLNSSLTVDQLADRAGISPKQLRRYLPGKQRELPKKIPMPTYYAILGALGKTHADFYSSCSRSLETACIEICVDIEYDKLTQAERKYLLSEIILKAKCKGKCIVVSIEKGSIKYRIIVSAEDAGNILEWAQGKENTRVSMVNKHSEIKINYDAEKLSDELVDDVRTSMSLGYKNSDISTLLDLDIALVNEAEKLILRTNLVRLFDRCRSDGKTIRIEADIHLWGQRELEVHELLKPLSIMYQRRIDIIKRGRGCISESISENLRKWIVLEAEDVWNVCLSNLRYEYMRERSYVTFFIGDFYRINDLLISIFCELHQSHLKTSSSLEIDFQSICGGLNDSSYEQLSAESSIKYTFKDLMHLEKGLLILSNKIQCVFENFESLLEDVDSIRNNRA